MTIKFTQDSVRVYVAGEWRIKRGHGVWTLSYDGCKLMSYTTLGAAKAGAADYARKWAEAAAS